MNNSICTLFDNILIDIHKFKSLRCKDERLNLLPCFKINNLFQKINKPLFTYKKTGKIVKIEQILDNNGSLRQHKHDSTL